MFLASPAITLESDELGERAAEIDYPPVHHEEPQQAEHQNYRDHREPVLDGHPPIAPACVFRFFVEVPEPVPYIRPAIIVLLVFIEPRLRHARLPV